MNSFANSAKILFIPAHNFDSHAKSMLPLAEGLAENGHQVSFWFPTTMEESKRISTDRVKIWETKFRNSLQLANEDDEQTTKLFWSMKGMPTVSMAFLWYASFQPCYKAIQENFTDIQKLMNEKWDLP